MELSFLVAGGRQGGLGHVRRCRTLAERLRDAARVRFVTGVPEVATLLASAGFTAGPAPTPDDVGREADVLVVDDPAVTPATLAAWRRRVRVVAIDDIAARPLPVDLVVNGSVGAERLAYRGADDTRYLLGARYFILRPGVATVGPRQVSARVERVLVLCGGGDAGAVAETLIDAVTTALPSARLDLVIGPWSAVPALLARHGGRVTVQRDPADLGTIMRAADLAVSGGGQTAYELGAAGTPTLGLQLAADQAANLAGLAAAGTLRIIPGAPKADVLARALAELAGDIEARRRMATAGPALVDGAGAARVAEAILSLGVTTVSAPVSRT